MSNDIDAKGQNKLALGLSFGGGPVEGDALSGMVGGGIDLHVRHPSRPTVAGRISAFGGTGGDIHNTYQEISGAKFELTVNPQIAGGNHVRLTLPMGITTQVAKKSFEWVIFQEQSNDLIDEGRDNQGWFRTDEPERRSFGRFSTEIGPQIGAQLVFDDEIGASVHYHHVFDVNTGAQRGQVEFRVTLLPF